MAPASEAYEATGSAKCVSRLSGIRKTGPRFTVDVVVGVRNAGMAVGVAAGTVAGLIDGPRLMTEKPAYVDAGTERSRRRVMRDATIILSLLLFAVGSVLDGARERRLS